MGKFHVRSVGEKNAINRVLGTHGLGTLEDPGVISQLAYFVEGHDHFRGILIACEPELRHDMYEAMKAHLRFAVKPLDVYISEAAAIAERKQLPTVSADGTLIPFKPEKPGGIEAEAPPEMAAIQRAVEQAVATGFLTVTCFKCTKQETFPGTSKVDAVRKIREAGWTWGLDKSGNGREICPACPGGLEKAMN